MKMLSVCFPLIFLLLCPLYQPSNSQQAYIDNLQLDCYPSNSSITKGYLCYGSGPQASCQSFVTFRSRPPYDSPVTIASLLGSDPASIALINNMSFSDNIPPENLVVVPISCSCFASFYQHSASYTMKNDNETAFTIVNNTYQGLTTCQAFINQNGYINQTIVGKAGWEFMVPLRCACPSENQRANGVSSLLTYAVTRGDTFKSIANDYGVNETSILDANMLLPGSMLFPFTTLLVPLKSKSCIRSPENFFCHCRNDFPSDRSLEGLQCKPDGKKHPLKRVIVLGTEIGVGILSLCLSAYILFRFLNNKRHKKRKQKLFEQNGGLLLQQRLSSHGSSEKEKIYTSEELQTATNNYNQSLFLGQGGFGTVYKGMLPDGTIVAVKRSKAIEKCQIEQFINEIVILSQINHRNVVKLLGCSLETEIPVLVYEFVPNGTLSYHLQDRQRGQKSPLSWDNRVRIACEIAGAIAYMHSAASIPIFHRDIKSSNILLDERYTAKVSDFGMSKSIPMDKTHLTTAVQGTFGYLDPEYLQSNQFTEKSDVYSFGVVLVELMTGKTPLSFARAEEKNLVAHFISLAKENHLPEILDTRVAKEAREEDIQAIAELAMRCLRLNGKKRPTMKQVAMELEGLRSQRCLEICQKLEQLRNEILYVNVEITEESRQGSTEDSLELSLQMEPQSF